jgi:hypothetical protein
MPEGERSIQFTYNQPVSEAVTTLFLMDSSQERRTHGRA